MSETAVINADVAEAIDELEDAWPSDITIEVDGEGGAYVTADEIALGPSWSRSTAPVYFHLPFNYPAASPYPYYLPADLELTAAWPPALQRIRWRDRDVIQVSLRHNNWDPQRDRILGCILQVQEWLQQ